MSDSHKKVLELLKKNNKSFEDKSLIIREIRNHQLKMQDVVLKYGLDLIKNHKSSLGSEGKYFEISVSIMNIFLVINFIRILQI